MCQQTVVDEATLRRYMLDFRVRWRGRVGGYSDDLARDLNLLIDVVLAKAEEVARETKPDVEEAAIAPARREATIKAYRLGYAEGYNVGLSDHEACRDRFEQEMGAYAQDAHGSHLLDPYRGK